MYALTEEQYQLQAEPILRKIFVNDNPYNTSLSSISIKDTVGPVFY